MTSLSCRRSCRTAPRLSSAKRSTRLIEYQGAAYAKLYADRLRRFVGKHGVDDAMFGEIARLMAMRMCYEDPIRIAQLKLAELKTDTGAPRGPSADDVRKFRLDELVDVLPAVVAEPVLDALEWAGWLHKRISIRFSNANWWGIRRLKIEASLRRWRRFSVRYSRERVWVERWLHMIDRSLTKQPAAASAMVQSATMVQGYGAPTAGVSPTGMRSSMAWPSRPSTACCRWMTLPVRWRKRVPRHCPIPGRPRSSAASRRSGRVSSAPARTPRRVRQAAWQACRSGRAEVGLIRGGVHPHRWNRGK